MISYFEKIKYLLNIDGAISFTILGKGVGILTTIFTVFFIGRYLSSEEQGYYYTFVSILSIQVFFELGLNNIITQFVAHEVSYLKIENNHSISGDIKYRSRLSSLLRFCIKWYCIFAIFMVFLMVIGGFVFFNNNTETNVSVTWKTPWILLAISTVLNFLTTPINAFIQGLGKIKEIALIRLIQQLILPLIVWGGLMIGAKLFVSGLYTLGICAVNIYMFHTLSFDKILINIWKDINVYHISYRKEIFPYQWKIALSWISGYFTFQLFNPVLFAVEGSVSAGKMGMTISAANAIQAILLSWINTKVPKFSNLIEQKKYKELDNIFFSDLKRITFLGIVLSISFITFILLLQNGLMCNVGKQFGDRFVSAIPLIFMTTSIFFQVPVTAWATYLRCHLKEPFFVNSIVLGTSSLLIVFFIGKSYGTTGLSIGYFIIQCISLVWAYIIFKNKREKWHK